MSNPKVVFHLGTYKTGTSSIQNMLHSNADLLQKNKILYPRTGLYKSRAVGHRHRGIITDYMDGRRRSYSQPELNAEIRESGCDMAIMSSEAWSHPQHMALLGGLVAEMQDDGFEDIAGVVFFRKLVGYKVSHYREFTFRSGNKHPYERYHVQGGGMFDYLFLARQYRTAFESRMNFLDFGAAGDSVTSFLSCLGLSHLTEGKLRKGAKVNTQSLGALGIEVMRLCNKAGLRGAQAADFLNDFEERNPDMFAEDWTERTAGDMLPFGRTYRRELSELTGWESDRIDELLADTPITGRHVSEAEPVLAEALAAWQEKCSA